MKSHLLVKVILAIVIFGFVFLNLQQQRENVSLSKSLAVQKEKHKEHTEREEELRKENERLSKKITTYSKSLKKNQEVETNDGVDSELNAEFVDIVSKLFETNLNFTPENFIDKKKEVAEYLSEELKQNFFGQGRNTYQDANSTTSRLESLEVYLKKLQNNELEGLIVAKHKSKQLGQDWKKGLNFFKVEYDITNKKVTKIENIGGGYPGK